MAPVLSFTADEIWQTLGVDEEATVFESTWYELPAHGLSASQLQDWTTILAWRAKAAKEIERVREANKVGSSLQAELTFYVEAADAAALNSLGEDLRFVMLTSTVTVETVASESEVKVVVVPSAHQKCARCWHYRADVGAHPEHPTICSRCESNLFGKGETRQYA